MAKEDYYRILGVEQAAPEREIKKAYYELARDLHPDKAKTPDEARTNAQRLATISKAYNVLKDPRKRAEYDAGYKGGGAAAPPPPRPPAVATATATPPGTTPPATEYADSPAPKISSTDIQSQRILTAQKAFVKGMEYYKQGEFRKALPFFDAAVKNDPDSEAHYHLKLAHCLVKTKGSFSRAVEAAERACELEAYNMDFKLGLAEIYETVGVASKAKAVYQEILKWEADNQRAKLRLSLLEKSDTGKKGNAGLLAKLLPSLFGDK